MTQGSDTPSEPLEDLASPPEDLPNQQNHVIFKEHGVLFAPNNILHVTFKVNNNDLRHACFNFKSVHQDLEQALDGRDISIKDNSAIRHQSRMLRYRIDKACKTTFAFTDVVRQSKAKRIPRAAGILGLVAAALITSTGFGIFNTAQVNELTKQVQRLQQGVQELEEGMNFFNQNFLLLQDIHTRLSAIEHDMFSTLENMKSLVHVIRDKYATQIHINAAISEFGDHVAELEEATSRFERGYTQLQNNKLSLDLLEPERLTEIWKMIHTNASETIKPLFPCALDLLHLPATYICLHRG